MSNKILLLRYSDFHGVDTIEEHTMVIKECGRCWWAKIGKQPSVKYLQQYLEQGERIVLLYSAGVLYKCTLGTVLRERPTSQYPPYYDRDIFDKENEPTVYFELLSIEKINLGFLDDYVICSSGKDVVYDLKKTISSYMFIQHRDLPLPSKPKPREKNKKNRQLIFDKNSCVYKKEGYCNSRTCVNYKYKCERPQYCLKQKPIKQAVEE